jgi:hypothetical protein
MKRYLILLITFCGLFTRVCGQSSSAAIDSLIKYRIITAKQRPILEHELRDKARYASDRALILWGLYSIILQKTFHINPRKTGIMYAYSSGIHHKKSQDSINRYLRSQLVKINKAGLLTDRVYTYAQKNIDSSRYVAEVQLTGTLAEMSSRLEWLTPPKLLPVAEQLHQNGIVSDSSFTRLQDDIKNGKIESAFQLNNYCKLDRVFDLNKYPDDPRLWLEQLLRDISSILPNLHFTDFSYTTAPDPSSSIASFPASKYKVSLVCNGQTYKYSSVVSTFNNKQGQLHFIDIFAEFYYRIFNKVLTDQQSPYRLHLPMFSHTISKNDNTRRFALIALREEQTEVFMKDPCMSYMTVSMDNYDNTLTSVRVDSIIAAWKNIGLFNHLSKEEINKATDDAKADDFFSMNKLLSNFSRVVYPLDSLWMSRGYPYKDLLNHLAGITHGAFNPTKITQQNVKSGIKLQYLSKGKIHSKKFSTANGWLDAKFNAYLEGLSKENNLAGNFYRLSDSYVIYLNAQQYMYATKYKLLDFGDTIPETIKTDSGN